MSHLPTAAAPPAKSSLVQRLASIDAYRGMVMFLMMAEVLELSELAKSFPESRFFAWLRFHTTHVDWVGCSLHDMIQPSFSFLVGVSLPFSIVARRAKGASFGSMFVHALWRSIVLVLLGILLRSLGKPSTNFTFDDTLTQIGLGYGLLFLVALSPKWNQVLCAALILFGYWSLFAMWPLPAADFNFEAVGVPKDWPHLLTGFAAHWNKNMNPAWAFDVWFLNLFPRPKPFEFHPGGYATLSFVPTLATMIMGLLAGGLLAGKPNSSRSSGVQAIGLASVGAALLLAGWSLNHFGICPNVKRIWTPAFALFSGGICFIWMAVLHGVCDRFQWRAWAFPFMIFGSNSILAYVMSWTLEKPLKELLTRHFGEKPFLLLGEPWEHVLLGGSVLAIMWLVLFWLNRQRIFVRI